MEKEKNNIELNSEEYHEILADTPSWVLRFGLTLVFVIIILLLAGSAFFKYPDVIQAPVVLTGSIPPARVKTKTSGVLKDIYVKNNQNVEEGDYLASIQNSAKVDDVFLVKKYVNYISKNPDSLLNKLPDKELKMGDLQNTYSSFYQALFEYKKFIEYKYYNNKIAVINEQYNSLCAYWERLKKQREILYNQMNLTANGFRRDSILNVQGLISQENFEQSKKILLSSKLDVENINGSLNNVTVQIAQLKESLLDSENTYRVTDNDYIMRINNLVSKLLAEIQAWEINFVLIAPLSGKLSFNNYWTRNQNVLINEEVFSIVPKDNGFLFAKAYVPITRYGKVKIGQQVNIRLENFPDTEFGIVKGKVQNISNVPSVATNGEYYYTVEIFLPKGLLTSYKKELPYYPDMSGQVEIITDNMSLLERIFLPIKKIFVEGFSN